MNREYESYCDGQVEALESVIETLEKVDEKQMVSVKEVKDLILSAKEALENE